MTMPLADPTNYGNKPGDGPLRAGGQNAELPMAEEDRPDTMFEAAKRQRAALTLVRDLEAGADVIRNASTTYLPMNPGEDAKNYAVRLARSPFHNFFGRTVEGLTGLVFSVDPKFGEDVPPVIQEQWENLDNAGTHGDVWLRMVFADALTAGHNCILVEYPDTGGVRLSRAEEAPLRPYWLLVRKDDIMSWRVETVDGRQVLTQVVIRETRWVPSGAFGERKQTRYRVLRNDRGDVTWELLEVNDRRQAVQVAAGAYPTQTEIPLAEVTTSGYVAPLESVPPLLDLAYLNVAHYQQWSDYATSIHMTCVPILFGAGVPSRDDQGQQIVVGPNSAVWSPDPTATLSYTTHDGQALASCKQALDDLKSDMGTLGLAMLSPQKRTAETAEAKRLDKSTADSALSVAARGLQDAVERALQFHANYLRLPDGGSVEINRDFEGAALEPAVMTAYAALIGQGLPTRLVLEMLQRGGRIADDVDLDELEMEMAAEQVAKEERNAAFQEAMFGGAQPAPKAPEAEDADEEADAD